MQASATAKNTISHDGQALYGLVAALHRLDALLAQALVAAQQVYGAEAQGDRFRGLYLSPEDVAHLLERPPVEPLWQVSDESQDATPGEEMGRMRWLAEAFGLSSFDVDVLMLALAPELDLRYERLYAYLQDDVTRRHPSVDLALNLFCASAADRLQRRAHFAPDAPLLRAGLVHLLPDPHQTQPPLLAHYLKLDEQILRWLLAEPSLDERLSSFSEYSLPTLSWHNFPLAEELRQSLSELSQRARTQTPFTLHLYGPHGVGKRRLASALAAELERPLLRADLARMVQGTTSEFELRLRLLFRAAWLQDAVVLLDDVDALRGEDRALALPTLLAALAQSAVVTVLSSRQPPGDLGLHSTATALGIVALPVGFPAFAERRSYWQSSLRAAGIALDEAELTALASRFRLTPAQIADAVATACHRVDWTADWRTKLLAAARAQSSQDLAALAWKIEPHYTWADLVLPADALQQLHEICSRVAHQHHVLDDWGFGRKLSLGKGVAALFTGPSGTGKTMAAEVIANELGLDLYKIDLASVVSKYIGETEKNLDRIFTAAANANAILLIDEADALFGKRSEVRDAHDRYANIETAYLLQKMEQYEGIAILATNLRQNMDEAFTRRLQFIIAFPFPDEAQRRELWQTLLPVEAPRAADIDYEFLAKQFRLAGGNIKNIVLGAAFLAAAHERAIAMEHLLQATWRECQKMGRVCSVNDFGKYAEMMK